MSFGPFLRVAHIHIFNSPSHNSYFFQILFTTSKNLKHATPPRARPMLVTPAAIHVMGRTADDEIKPKRGRLRHHREKHEERNLVHKMSRKQQDVRLMSTTSHALHVGTMVVIVAVLAVKVLKLAEITALGKQLLDLWCRRVLPVAVPRSRGVAHTIGGVC
jgi:hypothetical protein